MRTGFAALARRAAVLACLGALGGAPDAFAHHAYVMFDVTREVTLRGQVKAYQWTSPHVWMELAIRDASGREMDWPIEAPSPGTLRRFGWTRNSMKPGDEIEMVIHPRKDGVTGGSLVTAVVNGQPIGRPA